MAQSLSQLKAASQKEKKLSDLEMLDIGETVWFTGASVSSESGTISLMTTNNCILVLREKDVINVNKEGDYFEVNVRTGTPVIVRTEHMMKAESSTCGCGEKENKDDVPETMAKEDVCLTFGWICKNYHTADGDVKQICVLVPKAGSCRAIVNSGPTRK
jgi:hypothetical protein